jgi:predicted alpha-1,2-mannosidase
MPAYMGHTLKVQGGDMKKNKHDPQDEKRAAFHWRRALFTKEFMFRYWLYILLGVSISIFCWGKSDQTPVDIVDPFIGTDSGNTVPGAQVPFGFLVLSPDTTKWRTSGYNSTGSILGFSHTHVSGTGGAGKYGNFLMTPLSGPLQVTDLCFSKSNESASPGYYSVILQPGGIRAELTATRLVGMHRYTFPASKPAHILLNVGSCISFGMARGTNQRLITCNARMTAPNRWEGFGDFVGGWNPSEYGIYFSVEFDRAPIAFGTWHEDRISTGSKTVLGEKNEGLFMTFDPGENPVVQVKLAVSMKHVHNARQSIEREIPGWNFDEVRHQAEELWVQTLDRIKVQGGTDDQRRIFYTSLYHCHVMPHDLTDENAWWDSDKPHYEEFYAIWDTFRTLHPLLTLIQPERQRDMMRSLVDTYVHTGWMPDARIAGANGMMQGGTNGDVLVADAIVKDLQGIDYALAYEALVKNAEVDSPRFRYEGRVLDDYKRLGYMSIDYPLSASRTMEYAYNDFCVAQVAKVLGKQDDYQKYLKRSANWTNLWDDGTKSIRPRKADGAWVEPFDHAKRFGSWGGAFYEGSPWQYSTYVPHDVQGLINRLGGDEDFVLWLDEFFDKGHYTQGNEPDILAPYLYIHSGRPDRTADRVRQILATRYKSTPAGSPGDDDAGTMSAWYVWGAIGLYPNAGQDYYYIGSPIFTYIELSLGGKSHLVIDAPEASETNCYVQSAKLNGKTLSRAWIYHSEIIRGGLLEFVMGPNPSQWGKEHRPPSVTK